MNNIYNDGTYLENNPSWHAQDSPWKAKQIIQMLNHHKLDLATICEVGCGAGEILNQLSNKMDADIKYYGYDISPQAFNICSQKTKENLVFYQDNLLEKDVYYDLVMAIDVFEHVENYYDFLRELKDKGRYKLFHIPLDLSVQTLLRVKPILHIRHAAGHIHYFTKELALASLNDMGYVIVDHFYTASALELPKRGFIGNLMKIPRRILFSINEDLCVRVLGGYSLMVLAK